MLYQSLFFILETVVDLLAGVFLLRFVMQWVRVPFRNPLGQFVIAASDWAVLPLRKLIPGLWGLDLASLLPAWLLQCGYYLLALAVPGLLDATALGGIALSALIETARIFLYLIFGIVIITSVMSWVNPYAPLAPVFNALMRPFLAPFQRFIPPLGGVDLSPIALIIVLQILLGVLASLRYSLIAMG